MKRSTNFQVMYINLHRLVTSRRMRERMEIEGTVTDLLSAGEIFFSKNLLSFLIDSAQCFRFGDFGRTVRCYCRIDNLLWRKFELKAGFT